MQKHVKRIFLLCLCLLLVEARAFSQDANPDEEGGAQPWVREAIQKSLALLELAAEGSSSNRMCFTCHGQAMPVIAFAVAIEQGFDLNQKGFDKQVEHTYQHLRRGRKAYKEGKGQGGGVDTAGYALWTLEDGGRERDEVINAVMDYIFKKQKKEGHWQASSNRPPSEASSFTSTYLALRAVDAFGNKQQFDKAENAKTRAAKWLQETPAVDTEDTVFALLSGEYAPVENSHLDSLVDRLKSEQNEDGGWAQTADMESDAYATGTVLYALHHSGVSSRDPTWQRGIAYLREAQKPDGSWYVKSRSKPFQTYFETGFPHGKDQFISTSATAWAALALMYSLD